jgi:hypothetical protein
VSKKMVVAKFHGCKVCGAEAVLGTSQERCSHRKHHLGDVQSGTWFPESARIGPFLREKMSTYENGNVGPEAVAGPWFCEGA